MESLWRGRKWTRRHREKAQQLSPDLILLDLSMPVMNGLDAARELRQLMPKVPLLMFTNFDNRQIEREALSSGINTIVSKSQGLSLLLHRIQNLLALDA